MSAYVFDLFGTLVDYGSLTRTAAPHTSDPVRLVELWRGKQIALSQAGSLMGRFVDFDAITRAALRYAAAVCGSDLNDSEVEHLGAAWERLPPFADVVPALVRLRQRGDRLAVLTNGTRAMLERTLASADLAQYFDTVLSAQEAAAYKPSPAVYALAVDRLALPKDRIRFVSSNGWDAAGAAEFGFTVSWCNRAQMPAEPLWRAPANTIASLAELV